MKISFKTIAGFVWVCCSSQFLHAQVFSRYEAGINAGSFIYQGDLTPWAVGSFKTPGLVIGINGSRYLTNHIAARLDLNFGNIRGNDAAYDEPAWRKERNFAFKTPATEIIGSIVYNINGREHRWSPYVFAGLGYSFLKIKRDYSNFNSEFFAVEPTTVQGLENDINKQLPNGLPILPMGLGIKYRLTNNFFINSEASYRYLSSDYLDGFSQAANAGRKDHYYKFSIGLIYSPYKRNNSMDCPRF